MATTDIRVNLGIDADNAKALASINGVKAAFDGVAGAASKADQAGALPNTQRQLSAIRSTLATFRQLLVAYAAFSVGASIIRSVSQSIDKFTLLDARMKAAAGSTAKAAVAYQQLSAVSRETAVPIADLANFFARTSDAVVQYGQSGVTAVELTRSVALGLKASGASASEAASAFLQFSQAINSGRLAGEEFRAVYEAAPRLVQAYAKALGISVGRLYELSKAQQLTTDKLINATTRVNAILAEEAAKVPSTIASATEAVSNAFGQVLARGANVSGLVANITAGLKVLEKNAEAVLVAFLGFVGGAVLGGILALAGGVRELTKQMTLAAVSAAAFKNPLAAAVVGGTIVAGLAATAYAFDAVAGSASDAADATKEFAGEQKKLNDALATAEIRLVDARKALADFDREQSVEGLKKSVEEANKALQFTNSEISRLQSAWDKALTAAEKYRQKAAEIRQQAAFKGADRKRAGMTEEAAQLDASVEYGSNYLKLQRLIAEIGDLVAQGDDESIKKARLLGKQAEELADRQEALIDQLKPSDAESAANRVARQTAQLFDVLAQLEDQQAKTALTALDQAESQAIILEEVIKRLQGKIEAIKDTDLALKRVTLIEQLDAAIAKVDELQGKLNGLTAGAAAANAPVTDFSKIFEGAVTPNMEKGIIDSLSEKARGLSEAIADYFRQTLGSSAVEQATAEEARAQAETVLSQFADQAAARKLSVNATVDAERLLAGANAASNYVQQNVTPIVVPVVMQPVGNFTEDGRQVLSAKGFAAGGAIRPPNAIDNLLGWFNKDEFVMRAQAVRKYGNTFMQSINSLQFPKAPAFAAGGPVGTPVNLYLPGGQSFGLSATPSVARELASILGAEVLKRGRR